MNLRGGALMSPEGLRRIRDNAIAGRYMAAKSKRRLRRPRLRGDVTGFELDDRNRRSNVESAEDGTISRAPTAHSIQLVTEESRP